MHARFGFASKAKYRTSTLWPGFREAVSVIDLHARWIIGNGYSVRFWCSNWLDDTILRSLQIDEEDGGFFARVCDFITDGRWTIPDEFSEAFPDIADRIRQIHLPIRDFEDTLIWPYSSTGDLSFCDAYHFLQPTVPVSWTHHLWDSHIPPRISTFVWRLLYRRLPTQDFLQLYGHPLANRCPNCESTSETIDHLFISCPFAVKAWRTICGFFAVSFRTFDSIMDMWLFVTHRSFCPQIFQLWVAAVLYTWDFIWHARNMLVFQDRRFTFHHFLTSLTGWLRMVSVLAKGHVGHSVMDITILRGLGVQSRPRRAPLCIPVHWLPPQVGWVKLNTDGMAHGSPGRAASGGVFRNHMGVVIGAYCFDVGIGTAFLAEISALIQGIEYAHQRGWHMLWIEVDSMAVLQCLQSPSYLPPWRVATRWDNCKQLLNSMRFYCSHIYREGNAVADRLASMGLDHEIPLWWDAAPPQTVALVGRDISSLPTYRFKFH